MLVLMIIGCLVCKLKSQQGRIAAPKLRKKNEEDPLAGFVGQMEATPMEDADPELVMNPVLLARMEMEKQNMQNKGRKGKGKKGKGGGGAGALRKLNLKVVSGKIEEVKVP